MGGYRVNVELEDPLATDEALCWKQRFNQRLVIHGILTVATVGMWLPVLIGWLITSNARMKAFSGGYAVRVRGGQLVVGNAQESRSVPLDAVADVSVNKGYVAVSVRGAQPLQVYGLRDPQAAAAAILDAREQHVRGLRADVREEAFESAAGPDVPGARAQR